MKSRSPTRLPLRQPVRVGGRTFLHATIKPKAGLAESMELQHALHKCTSIRDQGNALIAGMTDLPLEAARLLCGADVNAICTAIDQQVSAWQH